MDSEGRIKFTKQQLADWRAYERVRKDGSFNMFDPRARQMTGLSKERYSFALKNYSELKQAQDRARLKAECEALRKALGETPCERLLLQEMSLADSQVSSSCEPCTCWRKALAPR